MNDISIGLGCDVSISKYQAFFLKLKIQFTKSFFEAICQYRIQVRSKLRFIVVSMLLKSTKSEHSKLKNFALENGIQRDFFRIEK